MKFHELLVLCYFTVPVNETACTDGNITLRDGVVSNEGRVEICFGGKWGTICDDRWGKEEAIVVCRQLGFMDDIQNSLPVSQGFFGFGINPIHLDEVNCSGTEASLANCQNPGVGTHNCLHHEDAGVICISKSLLVILGKPWAGSISKLLVN